MADRILKVVNKQVRVSVAGGALVAALAGQSAAAGAAPYVEQAEAAAAAAEGFYEDVLAIQALGDDAAAIAARASKAENGADFADPGAVLDNLPVTQEGDGAIDRPASDKLRDVKSVLDFGAKGDWRRLTDGYILAGSSNFDSDTADFTADDIGKVVTINGAGVAGAKLTTTIASIVSEVRVTLTASASTNALNVVFSYGTDDTVAIQKALDCGGCMILFPGGRATRNYLFTNLTKPFRVSLMGDGPRGAVLYQKEGATGTAFAFDPGIPDWGVENDVSDGICSITNVGLNISSSTGIKIADGATASMFETHMLRMTHRNHDLIEEGGLSEPYSVVSGTVGIDVDGGDGTETPGAVFVASHTMGEIRGFETGVRARRLVNEWQFRNFWTIDCKNAYDVSDASTWRINGTVETGVANARALILRESIANLVWEGGRWEMRQSGCYGVEFDASLNEAANLAVRNVNVSIFADASGLPGRKWTGTAPASMWMEGTYLDPVDGEQRYYCIAPSGATVRMPSRMRLGGAGLGDAEILLMRNVDNAAAASIKNDGGFLVLSGSDGVKIPQLGGGSSWQLPFWLGPYALWVDGSGKLRIKAGTPTSDTDGTVVGTQT